MPELNERLLTPAEIVRKVIGPIEPVGETRTDEIRLDNLRAMVELVNGLVSDLYEVAKNDDRVEYSMKTAGELARKAIENLKEW